MKNFLLLALALILGGSLMAQDTEKKVIIIKKNKDGSITKIEKAVNQDDDTVIFIREAGESAEEMHFKANELKGKLRQLPNIRMENGDYDRDRRLVPEKATKAFLGVVAVSSHNGKGFLVNRVVGGSGAEAGGLQQGDVVQSINGISTNGSHGLTGVLAQFQPNDQVTLSVLRDGLPLSLNVTLTEKAYTRYVLNEERNPCDVFIGVYTTDHAAEEGVRVTSIIGNTPAELYGLNAGDIILALDGVEVASGNQLRYERDKHNPGDEFQLLVNRSGDLMDVKARFKACEEPLQEEIADELIAPIKEQPALVPTEKPETLLEQSGQFPSLELQDWQAYPNPSLGDITIEFKADPTPTNIRLIDASGKVIYQEQLNNFDGLYKKELNLRQATPGTLLLSIQQGDKVVSKQLILLNRA